MTDHVVGRHEARPAERTAPRPLVGVAVVVVYLVVVYGLQLSTGLKYVQWTSTAANGLRAGVVPLAVGGLLLVAFLAYARWDMVWRDPARLPMTAAMKVAMVLFALFVVVRVVGIAWSSIDLGTALVVLAIGVLVGFAEETLFRGIVLRSLRTGGRSEGRAALWTTVGFGLFHLPLVLVGAGAVQLVQVVLTAVIGLSLYFFRRRYGLLWPAMIAHGVWDVTTFFLASHGADWAVATQFALLPVALVVGIVALVSTWRTDRHTVVTPDGISRGETA